MLIGAVDQSAVEIEKHGRGWGSPALRSVVRVRALVHRDSFLQPSVQKLNKSLHQICFRAFIAGVRSWRFLKKSCHGSAALMRFA